jgi:hypothetical protein
MEPNVPLGGKGHSSHHVHGLGSLTVVVSEFNKWGQVVNDEALCS